jgi:hypothetical protein
VSQEDDTDQNCYGEGIFIGMPILVTAYAREKDKCCHDENVNKVFSSVVHGRNTPLGRITPKLIGLAVGQVQCSGC